MAIDPGYTQRPYTPQTGGGLSSNVAAGLAYITIIPAIIFLVIEPYKRDSFVRFHSWQSIFFYIAVVILRAIDGFLFVLLPITLSIALLSLIGIALFAVWLIAMINAFQGKMWQIPIVGGFAASQSGARSSTL